MSPGEAAKRVQEQLRLWASIPRSLVPRANPWSRFAGASRLSIAPLPHPKTQAPVEWAFYCREIALQAPMPWHAGVAGSDWPARHHALLSHHVGNPLGDVRPVWEVNRLQFLPHVAAADPDRAVLLLRDWLKHNPYRMGPAWMSAMEVALRWLPIYRTVGILGGRLPADLERDLVGLARASGRYLLGHPSTHSSAGNHLILEGLGMVWIALSLDPIPREMLEKGRRILREQALRQIRPDGTGIEGSTWYLGFVIDAYQHWLLLDADAVDEAVRDRLRVALGFIHEVVSPEGVYPDLGDRDDGYAFRDGGEYGESSFPALLEVGGRFFDKPEWRRDSPGAARRSTWWFSGSDPSTVAEEGPQTCTTTHFESGGLVSLRWKAAKMLLNCGQLGMPSTFGHGHAGALALTVTWGDTELLVDPGTGAYGIDAALRDHFRSTPAHNTVTLGGRDQARMLGTFLWQEGWTTQVQVDPDGVRAVCDAYESALGVTHLRRLEWLEPQRWVVEDRFAGAQGLDAEAWWHLGPDCVGCAVTAEGFSADFGSYQLDAVVPPGTAVSVHRGEAEPMRGWLSPLYGERIPGFAVRIAGVVDSDSLWRTEWSVTER